MTKRTAYPIPEVTTAAEREALVGKPVRNAAANLTGKIIGFTDDGKMQIWIDQWSDRANPATCFRNPPGNWMLV